MILFCSSDIRPSHGLASLGAARKRRNLIQSTSDLYNLHQTPSDSIRLIQSTSDSIRLIQSTSNMFLISSDILVCVAISLLYIILFRYDYI